MPDVSKSEAASASGPREGDGERSRYLQSHNRSDTQAVVVSRVLNSDALRAKLAALSRVEPDGCVVCTKSHNGDGYRQIRIDVGRGARQALAHRVAYEIAHGPIPAGMVVDHVCRNRACINVAHLRCVTQAENVATRIQSPRGCRVGRYRAPSEARRAAQRRYAAKVRALAGAAS